MITHPSATSVATERRPAGLSLRELDRLAKDTSYAPIEGNPLRWGRAPRAAALDDGELVDIGVDRLAESVFDDPDLAYLKAIFTSTLAKMSGRNGDELRDSVTAWADDLEPHAVLAAAFFDAIQQSARVVARAGLRERGSIPLTAADFDDAGGAK